MTKTTNTANIACSKTNGSDTNTMVLTVYGEKGVHITLTMEQFAELITGKMLSIPVTWIDWTT